MSSAQPQPAEPGEVAEDVVARVVHSPLLSLLAIALAVVGGFLMGWSFLTGIAEAIRPLSQHNSLWIALFFVGTGLDIVAIILAIVGSCAAPTGPSRSWGSCSHSCPG